jgi:hypothetical protein
VIKRDQYPPVLNMSATQIPSVILSSGEVSFTRSFGPRIVAFAFPGADLANLCSRSLFGLGLPARPPDLMVFSNILGV